MTNLHSIYHDVKVGLALPPQSQAQGTTVNGSVIDTAGYEGVAFLAGCGVIDLTVTFKLQTGTLSDGSDMADVAGMSQAFSGTDDNKATVLDLYQPKKRYARLVSTVAAGVNPQLVAGMYALYNGRVHPETQTFGGAFAAGA